MKAKTVKAVLRKKVDDWAASIEDEVVRNAVLADTIVTGGCIASMLLREQVNDFDVYFKTRDTAVAVANYYISRFKAGPQKGVPVAISVDERATDRVKIVVKSAGIAKEDGVDKDYQYFEARPADEASAYVSALMDDAGAAEDAKEELDEAARDAATDGRPKYRPVFLSTNAITLSHGVQIVLRFYGEPDAIHENYDFAHCMNYWTAWNNHLELRAKSLEALLTRELRYVGSKYPVCSLIRVRKFVARGWSINAGQILKMVMQCQTLNLTDVKVLEDQLTGVDVAYFCQLVASLREKDPEKVDTAYLVEILDRMF